MRGSPSGRAELRFAKLRTQRWSGEDAGLSSACDGGMELETGIMKDGGLVAFIERDEFDVPAIKVTRLPPGIREFALHVSLVVAVLG